MRNFLLASVAVLSAAPAVAADLPTKKAPAPILVPTEYDWTGIFLGGNIGYGFGTRNFDAYNQNGVLSNWGSDNLNALIGGGQVGYRYMFPQRIVIGAEASLDWNGTSKSTNPIYFQNNYYSSSLGSSGLSGNALGIAGYAWGDFLPYVAGGWAWSNQTLTRNQIIGTVGGAKPGTTEDLTSYRSGWTIGGGLDYHIWGNWDIFGQYLYSSFGNANVYFPTSLLTVRSTLKTNAVTFGLNIKL